MEIKTGIFLSMLILFGVACSESEESKPPVRHIASFSGQESAISYGSPVAVRIKKIDPDSLEPPTVVPVGNLPRIVPDRRRVIPVKEPKVVKVPETLTVITPGKNGAPLPETVPAKGKVVPAIHPPPVPALPLQKKDNAVTEIRYLDVGEGMNATGVWCMLEDSRGNLWFGTIGGGASRYDGSSFTHYTMEEGLGNNFIRSIYEDSRGNLWFGTWGGGVVQYDGEYFTHFNTQEGLRGNGVLSVVEDKQGHMWFGTDGHGLTRYDGQYFTHFTTDHGLQDNFIWVMKVDRRGHLWLGLHDRGVVRYDGTRFTHYTTKEGLIDNRIRSVCEDSHGNLWFGTLEGVSRFDGVSFTNYTLGGEPNSYDVYAIVEDDRGNLWFGTDPGGVIRYDGASFTRYTTEEGLSHNNILSMLKDRSGKLWFGTWGAGVSRYNEIDLTYLMTEEGLVNRDLRAMLEDSRGNLWFGTGDNGVSRYDSTGFMWFTTEDGLKSNNTLSLIEDSRGHIWIGHNNYGLSRFDGESFTNYAPESGLNQASAVSLLEDSRGNLWIGGMNRKLTLFDGETFTHFDMDLGLEVTGNCIYSILEDKRGNIWFGTWGGAVCYDGEKFLQFTTEDGLGSNFIMSILEDSYGNLWFGSWGGGLSRFTPLEDGTTGGVFTRYSTDDGLNNNWVLGIVEDRERNIWVNTLKGFTVLIPLSSELSDGDALSKKEYRFLGISQEDGVERTNFSWNNSLCLDSDDRLWWGTKGHLTMLDLNHFEWPDEDPQIKLNTIEIAQAFVDYRRLSDPAYRNNFSFGKALAHSFDSIAAFQNYPENLRLPHTLNHLTFHFAAIDWSAPEKLKYSYLLEGLDQEWSSLSPENKVEYRNLSPGSYTFKVKAVGAAQLWSDVFEYAFVIRPPWWKTWWAYSLYLILIASVLYSLYRFQLNRKLAAAETIRLKEMDAVKTRLYTNITHEFRTPLTVISGMVDQVRENPNEWLRQGLDMIKRNSGQLLTLVNQMLELSKLESNTLAVNLIQNDIVSYLNYLTESFHSYAETKNIRLHFQAEPETIIMDYDPDKIQTIVRNLVGNAIKFTPEGGTVWVNVNGMPPWAGEETVRIRVKDNGIGIPEVQLPHIFDRFYQADDSATRKGEGTGIGLALTKELVKLLKGRIEVESREGQGTTFTVRLPVSREAPGGIVIPEREESRPSPTDEFRTAAEDMIFIPDTGQEAPLALIIEDNKDVVNYLKACIQDTYQVAIANDGKAGIEKAVKIVPDIIISDVMMPEKDGFEVCATLKQDERTSHIPIILLTAKADEVSRREGLQRGADAYLVKPFDKPELEIRLQKLIELRQRLKEKYGKAELETVDPQREKDPELLFLKRLQTVILENLSDENFRVEPDLCRAMMMSRPQLYKKLKALKDQSPSQFMRNIRLQQARKLLQQTRIPIGEIADQVGFREHSYFTKVYLETFNETPSDTRNNMIVS